MSDFYEDAARQRLKVLEAAKAQSVATLEAYRATDDEYSAAEELQALATINDQIESLNRLHSQYRQQMNPPAPPVQTDEQWRAKPVEQMNYSDVAKMAARSKYGFDDTAFRAGIQEVARRRSRGE